MLADRLFTQAGLFTNQGHGRERAICPDMFLKERDDFIMIFFESIIIEVIENLKGGPGLDPFSVPVPVPVFPGLFGPLAVSVSVLFGHTYNILFFPVQMSRARAFMYWTTKSRPTSIAPALTASRRLAAFKSK